jgi:hypothetical protein
MHPKALQDINGVEYVRFVGCIWSFCPGYAPFCTRSSKYSARRILEGSIKARLRDFPPAKLNRYLTALEW